MRVFTAIPLPNDVKDKFAEISRGKLSIPYVNTANFHITLNFLGDLDMDHFQSIKKFWTEEIPDLKKFRVDFDALINFRHQIHMTLKENPALLAMQDVLQKHFLRLGYKPTYPKYYPHVTIGSLHMDRVMNRERKITDFPNHELAKLSFEADRIVLYESKLLLHHSHYIELAEHMLK